MKRQRKRTSLSETWRPARMTQKKRKTADTSSEEDGTAASQRTYKNTNNFTKKDDSTDTTGKGYSSQLQFY